MATDGMDISDYLPATYADGDNLTNSRELALVFLGVFWDCFSPSEEQLDRAERDIVRFARDFGIVPNRSEVDRLQYFGELPSRRIRG